MHVVVRNICWCLIVRMVWRMRRNILVPRRIAVLKVTTI